MEYGESGMRAEVFYADDDDGHFASLGRDYKFNITSWRSGEEDASGGGGGGGSTAVKEGLEAVIKNPPSTSSPRGRKNSPGEIGFDRPVRRRRARPRLPGGPRGRARLAAGRGAPASRIRYLRGAIGMAAASYARVNDWSFWREAGVWMLPLVEVAWKRVCRFIFDGTLPLHLRALHTRFCQHLITFLLGLFNQPLMFIERAVSHILLIRCNKPTKGVGGL